MKTELRDLLACAAQGNAFAQQRFTDTLYGELRHLAGHYADQQPPGPLQLEPTAIVNEAMLKMLGPHRVDIKSRTHFCATAAVAMRCVLVDQARARNAAKRGGGVGHVTLQTRDAVVPGAFVDAIVLHDLLERFAELSERAAKVVEMRVYGGMTATEIADALGVSMQTVKGDWRTAKAWLQAELKEHGRDET